MRKTSNFLDSWLNYMSPLPTPEIFQLWAGLAAISSVLSRRVWLSGHSRMPPCYPNLYLMLIGGPGVGKDVAINKVADCLFDAAVYAQATIGNLYSLGPESISPKGLLDKLAHSDSTQTCTYLTKNGQVNFEFQSLTFCVGEATTAISEYDPKLIGILNDLYNCKRQFEDRVRGVDVFIKNPHLTLLFGNQPDTLAEVFPERTFRMGFTSRIIFVFADKPVRQKIFLDDAVEAEWDSNLWDNLCHDLANMATMAGPLQATREAQQLINEFNEHRPNPVDNVKFLDYNTRRPLHAQKLAICVSAAESSKGVITADHWNKALELMFAAEEQMPVMFDNVTTSRGFSETYREIENFQPGKPTIARHELVMKLARTHPPHEVRQILDLAVADGVLITVYDEGGAPKKPHEFKIRRP